MQYQVTGKIIKVGSVIPVTGKVKEKCTFIVRDEEDSGREIAFLLFDEKIDMYLRPLEIGDKVKVTFTIKSREFINKGISTGDYSTNCFAINVEKIEDTKKQQGRNRYNQKQDDNYGDPGFGGFGGFGGGYRQKQQQQQNTNQPPPWGSQKNTTTDYFTGVRTSEEAKKRYRQLCKDHHPDKPGGSTEKMQEINKQYDRWK